MAVIEIAKFALTTPSTMPVTTRDTARERLHELHDTLGLSWRKIADSEEFKGFAPGTLCRFANDNWEPRGFLLRQRLGLPRVVGEQCPRGRQGAREVVGGLQEEGVECPDCHSGKVRKLMSAAAFKCNGNFVSTASSGGCSGCSSHSCSSCG